MESPVLGNGTPGSGGGPEKPTDGNIGRALRVDLTETPKSPTTRPCAPWATASWAFCTAAYATTPDTTNTRPGHTAPQPRLDNLEPWDVYKFAHTARSSNRQNCKIIGPQGRRS